MGGLKAGVTSLLDRSCNKAVYFRSWAPFCFCLLYPLKVYNRIFNFSKKYLIFCSPHLLKEKILKAGG